MTLFRGRNVWLTVAGVVVALIVAGAVVNVVLGAIFMLARLVVLVAVLGVVAWLYLRHRKSVTDQPDEVRVRPLAQVGEVVPTRAPRPDADVEQELEALKRSLGKPPD